jgi:DNA polymerase III alpha subunit (gram-positive type)
MAAQGMANTGYAESSQVSMYNTYQMRVTAAREAIERARLNYDNQIHEAKLQNDSKKAEIAYQTLQTSLALALEGFQYKNTLIAELNKQKQEIKNNYYNRYLAELEQINAENTLKETVRRNNAEIQLAQDELAEKKRQFDRLHPEVDLGGGGGGGGGGSKSSGSSGSTKGAKASGKDSSSIRSSKSTAKSTKNTSSEPTVDMSSVLALGYGPISASRLNQLVKSGVIEEYVSGGKLKYRKTASTIKQTMLFGGRGGR